MCYTDLDKEELIGILFDIQKEVSELKKNVSEIALVDDVTNLYNRKLLCKTLEYEMKRTERGYGFLSVLLLEIDNFDDIKEKHGEDVSNSILKQISELILKTIRSIDIVGKYDKSKFMLILPDMNPNKGWAVSERIKKLMDREISTVYFGVKISIGVKNYEGESINELIEIAETNLCAHKKGYVSI